MERITLAGGCFWGLQAYLRRIRGVTSTRTGFANGSTPAPTYKEVYTDTTGYAEAVEVTFDPAVVGLSRLLTLFFRAIDPLSRNRQGEDTGTRYRTGVYYSPGQLPVCRAATEGLSARLGQPTAVELLPLESFYPAEEYHQDYLEKHTDGYCHLPLSAFREAAEAAVWPETPVHTVTGDIPAAALGKTLAHEHTVCVNFTFGKDFSRLDKELLTARGLTLFRALREAGYTGFLDATPYGFGRDLPLMETLSREAGILIVPAAGYYWFNPPEIETLSRQQLGDFLLERAEKGFPGTNIRPGFLKCGVQGVVSPKNKDILAAVARVHRETGLPIVVHTCRKTAAEAADRLLEAGVAPGKLTIGHTGDYFDLDFQLSLAEKGVFLGMDRTYGAMASRAEAIAALCRAGYAGQLVLSHDRAVLMDFSDPAASPAQLLAEQAAGSPRHFLYLEDTLLPLLRERNVTSFQLWRMQWDNPGRFFTGRGE